MKSIPQINLALQYQNLRKEIDEAISHVLENGMFILGDEVASFERSFAEYCNVAYGIAVSSGTDALRIALLAAGVGKGNEVITVSNASIADVSAIEDIGAVPVLVDIDPYLYTMDTTKATAAITPLTKAVLAVHLYGCPVEMAPLLQETHARNIRLIEDCSQAHGALYRNKKMGAWGDLAAFSFYPTKNLGAYGDAGMVLTSDKELDAQLRQLRQYGWEERYNSQIKGFNNRMDELQAAVLCVKLRHLDEWNARRRYLAQLYTRQLSGTGLILPTEPTEATHIYHQYVIQTTNRDQLNTFLQKNGISSSVHYPIPVHLQLAYDNLGYRRGDLPVTENVMSQILSLPLYPEMDDEDVERVCKTIHIFQEMMTNGNNQQTLQ